MEWKWRCKFCGELLDSANKVLMHILAKHQEAILYSDPIAIDKWVLPKKEEKKPMLPMFKKKPEPDIEEDEAEGEMEDLRIPE